ncbi:MAG: tRNA (N6-threonylcarbamoyladenosine(37)-N6)-methyltransferase TrmO [Prevotella sp.]|nr:tRNA (N6-threonylcarbamoyladenosine(37)-N6)-methyltransferase TrmO [Prevotella sp.]
MNSGTIHPVAVFHSPFISKFGIPRQSGIVEEVEGTIVLEPPYRHAEALRGLEDFDFIWLIWGFSANNMNVSSQQPPLTVRPPLLGGNTRIGVFATRSPFRPNGLGLSSVRISHIDWDATDGPIIHVLGADLMDGTPIYDIKPYLVYADSHPEAKGGFTDKNKWKKLKVVFADDSAQQLSEKEQLLLQRILELDPRPHYQDDSQRIYGMSFGEYEIHFKVDKDVLIIVKIGNKKRKIAKR